MNGPLDLIRSRLLADSLGFETLGDGKYKARCPSHDDRNPSLAVSSGSDGRVLLKCHTGCSTESIVRDLGLEMKDLFEPREKRRIVATYEYQDEKGRLRDKKHRYDPKSFGWCHEEKGKTV